MGEPHQPVQRPDFSPLSKCFGHALRRPLNAKLKQQQDSGEHKKRKVEQWNLCDRVSAFLCSVAARCASLYNSYAVVNLRGARQDETESQWKLITLARVALRAVPSDADRSH